MTVYVDNMRASFGRMKMCHMVADTSEELLAMADRIGVARKWIQKQGTPHEHFDIAMSKRALAVKAGAVEVSTMDIGRIIRAKRGSALKNSDATLADLKPATHETGPLSDSYGPIAGGET